MQEPDVLTLIPWGAMYLSFPALPLATAKEPPISAATVTKAETEAPAPPVMTWHPAAPTSGVTPEPPRANSSQQAPQQPSAIAGHAHIHLIVDYRDAQLERRDELDAGVWRSVCAAPCDRLVLTENQTLRVSAPKMSSSNAFLIQPGDGVASVRVAGGSSSARVLGTWALGVGLPLTLGGGALYAYGRVQDDSALRVSGIALLATGAISVIASLPLLLSGTTTVRSSDGKFIAQAPRPSFAF